MSGVATAIVGGAVIGGYMSNKAADSAADAQNQATAAAAEASSEQIAFQREQYADWKDTYGDVQEQISRYYKELTPATVEAIGLANIEREYATSKKALDQILAQRGLSGSGLAAAGHTQLLQAKASERAAVRTNAENQVIQDKKSFLGLGLNLESSLTSGIANAYGSQATSSTLAAAMYGQQAGQAAMGVGTAMGQGVSSYLTYNALSQRVPVSSAPMAYNANGTAQIQLAPMVSPVGG